MNERFQTHSHSPCVSHSNIQFIFRGRIKKRNEMRVMEKYGATYFLKSPFE